MSKIKNKKRKLDDGHLKSSYVMISG